MLGLVEKIKHALGRRARVAHELLRGPESSFFISSIGIKDDKGYFRPNIELMSGSSAESRLVKKTGREEQVPGYFILMKIDSGVPDYFYLINTVVPEDDRLYGTLRQLLEYAAGDFNFFKEVDDLTEGNPDTLILNGYRIELALKGQNHSIRILLPVSGNIKMMMEKAEETIKAATGPGYVYHSYGDPAFPQFLYFSNLANNTGAYVYLSAGEDMKSLEIKIMSKYSHAVKRNRN
jgi:hypothetical protein